MNLQLLNDLMVNRFFSPDSKYVNHKIVEVVSINDEERIANLILQRYFIGKGASVSTNKNNLLNVVISYDELKKVNSLWVTMMTTMKIQNQYMLAAIAKLISFVQNVKGVTIENTSRKIRWSIKRIRTNSLGSDRWNWNINKNSSHCIKMQPVDGTGRLWYKTHLAYGVSSWLFEIYMLYF